jgi:hypothetical protein
MAEFSHIKANQSTENEPQVQLPQKLQTKIAESA